MLKITKTNLFLRENHNEKTNSFYLYFTGNENLGAKLRKDVAGELIQHINDYRQHPHLIACSAKMSVPVEVLQQYLVADDAARKEDPLGFEASQAAKDKRWSSVLHLLAASTVLQRTIVSVYPSVRFNTLCLAL